MLDPGVTGIQYDETNSDLSEEELRANNSVEITGSNSYKIANDVSVFFFWPNKPLKVLALIPERMGGAIVGTIISDSIGD